MAKRRILAGGLILFLLIRLLPGFAGFWQKWISLPALGILAELGSRLPFVLLEWGGMACGGLLAWSLARRRFPKRLLALGLALIIVCIAIWYPLYFSEQPPAAALPHELATLSQSLIDELNASPPDFSVLPELPAKTARFPGWMRFFSVNGVCAFFTGEAIVSPELSPAALPFTAVHEKMHLLGVAGEGAANIAAYEACMELGGSFASSARLFALRYAMGELRRMDEALYAACMRRMNADTRLAYQNCGGSWQKPARSPFIQNFFRTLGIEIQLRDYEILAHYLAAGLRQ